MTQKTPSFYNTFEMDPRKVATELELGLTAPRAHCSPKYFYNALGSTLFEAITHLPEYYPTRTEASILTEHASAIHLCIPNNAAWVDLGAGSCQKAASLFAATTPGVYVAVDISLDYLTDTLVNLQRERIAAWIGLYRAAGGGWQSPTYSDKTPSESKP